MATTRSHPPALLRRTLRTLREETSLAPGDTIVVGVSGGGDSMALLHVLSALRDPLKFQLVAHGVDHGLRPEAQTELQSAQLLAEQLSVPFESTAVRLQPGGNLQARARDARYTALDEAARSVQARFVATAHHSDDRAETLLIRLLRGTGPRGLAVLPAEAPGRLRPFIRSDRAAILAHLERRKIPFAQDPSNLNPRYLRTRVRHELLPLFEQLAHGATDRLNRLADEMAAQQGVLPRVTQTDGRPLDLGPVHSAQLRRAMQRGQKNVGIWLPGGELLQLDPRTGQPSVHSAPKGIHSAKNPRAPEEKPLARGGKRPKSD